MENFFSFVNLMLSALMSAGECPTNNSKTKKESEVLQFCKTFKKKTLQIFNQYPQNETSEIQLNYFLTV